MSQTLDAITVYSILALIYLIITTLLSYTVHWYEKRLQKHVTHHPSF
jgi:ABC-type arginine/histidine transport system permease subunit